MSKNQQFGKALRALRDVMHLKRWQLAQFVGMPERVIENWEQYRTLPSFELFINLLHKLGPDADYLLKALAIQGEMVESPRAIEEAGNKWADRAPSPIAPVAAEETPAKKKLRLRQKVEGEKGLAKEALPLVKVRTRT